MNIQTSDGVYANISQRVAVSHLKSLSALVVTLPEGLEPGQQSGVEAAQRDLHAFFHSLYETMAHSPELFGLPLAADIDLPQERGEGQIDKQEANRRLSKPRTGVDALLDFLMAAGQTAALKDGALVLSPEAYAACQTKPKAARKFTPGLAQAGLDLSEGKEQVILTSSRYPAMLPALQMLAAACAGYTPANLARFHFARCDFRALTPGYRPDVLDMYAIFGPETSARLVDLHEFFVQRGYKTDLQIHNLSTWLVQYQGNRKIKSSPFFQVEYQDRFNDPLMLQIKCASANRITALLPRQSPQLQADFFQRSLRCNGDKCNWCAKHKGMGPSLLVYNGEEYVTCWYVPPDIHHLNEETSALIKEYALMHEALLN